MWPPSQWPNRWTLIDKMMLSCFSSFFGQTKWDFLFEVHAEVPEMDPENSAQWYIHYIHYHSYFCWFSCYLFIRITSISFFGHPPWTLKTSPNNIDHHSYFFLIFSLFYSHFHLEMQIFPYLEMPTGPWKQYHMGFYIWKCILDPETRPTVSTIPIFSAIFPIFFCYFSFVKPCISFFRNAPCTLKSVP